MSIIPGSPFRSLDGSPAQFLLSFLGPHDLGVVAVGKFGFVSNTKHIAEATNMDLFHS